MAISKRTERNALIAEFLGFYLTDDGYKAPSKYKWMADIANDRHYDDLIAEELNGKSFKHYLRFDKSWEWLMPACKHWDDLSMGWDKQQRYEYEGLCEALDSIVACYELAPVYNQLVDCIVWYNRHGKIKKEKK